jgi:hypothetical protein
MCIHDVNGQKWKLETTRFRPQLTNGSERVRQRGPAETAKTLQRFSTKYWRAEMHMYFELPLPFCIIKLKKYFAQFILTHDRIFNYERQHCNVKLPNTLHPGGIRTHDLLVLRRPRWPLHMYATPPGLHR